MNGITEIEKDLWSVADTMRANSNFASNEYFLPVMGLIFLRHAYSRFKKAKEEIEPGLPTRGGKKRALTKDDFHQRSAIFLPEIAQFPYLVAVPDGGQRGQKLLEAMEAIESDYPDLTGVLPKQDYMGVDDDLLGDLLRTFNNPKLEEANGDVFGRIYEYFLTQFADQKAHDNGEFFTPPSLVQTIVNVIEPDHGNILDPACGSGGMFVQSAHFIERMQANPNERVTFYGMEKNAITIRLAKMNLAVHGLEGNIAQAITYYEDPHAFTGKADFVMANPPFNVDEIDAEKVKDDPRLAFGVPGENKKKKVQNGNYVWLSYFHSYLAEKGRAGIVMSSQASSSGGEEGKVRAAMIKTGDVDVMIAIRSNFFYTRTVPCELWFFDKGKPQAMQNKVLMIDARQIYNVYSRKIYDFTPEQKQNIAAIVWLYRGQQDRFLALIGEYLAGAVRNIGELPLDDFTASCKAVFAMLKDGKMENVESVVADMESALSGIVAGLEKISKSAAKVKIGNDLASLKKAEGALSGLADEARESGKAIDAFCKKLGEMLGEAGRNTGARKARTAFEIAHGALKGGLASFRNPVHNASWLLTRFPDASLTDVEGLVKLVDRTEIEANDWSLSPPRYVGVAPEVEDEGFDFEESMKAIHGELESLNAEATDLSQQISKQMKEMNYAN